MKDTKLIRTKFWPFLMLLFLTNGCLNLDPFLFTGEKLDEYMLDSYTGERECDDAIDTLGFVPDSETVQKELKSGSETIAAVILSKKKILSSNDTMILFFHGNYHHLDLYWPRARLLYETGYSVMIIDYRGYGKSTGVSTEEGIYEDGIAALNYIRDSLGNPKIVLSSFSLGTLVGCEIASKYNVAPVQIISLILEAPIGSVETIAEDAVYLNIPGSYVSTYKGDNAQKIKNVSIPLLWIHGTKDDMLARQTNGQPIWDNYSGKGGYYVVVEGGLHSNLPKIIGYTSYIKCIRDFIIGHADSNVLMHSK